MLALVESFTHVPEPKGGQLGMTLGFKSVLDEKDAISLFSLLFATF